MTPTKNDTPSPRVVRGGCWGNDDPSWMRPAFRFTVEPDDREDDMGFRTTLPSRQPNTHTHERTRTMNTLKLTAPVGTDPAPSEIHTGSHKGARRVPARVRARRCKPQRERAGDRRATQGVEVHSHLPLWQAPPHLGRPWLY